MSYQKLWMEHIQLHSRKCVIKFILDTKNHGLNFEPHLNKNVMLDVVCYSNSDYAGYTDLRNSLSGYILYVSIIPIRWRSKALRSITLSSSEAELAMFSKAMKKLSLWQLLESMGTKVSYPIIAQVDDVGAIFMSNNIMTTSHNEHVDIRYK